MNSKKVYYNRELDAMQMQNMTDLLNNTSDKPTQGQFIIVKTK